MRRLKLWVWVAAAAMTVGFSARASEASTGPKEGWRQLRLETFQAAWRIINDSYFDPHFGGIDWTAVRTKFRKRAAVAQDRADLREVIQSMLDLLGQSHMRILPGRLAPKPVSATSEGAAGDFRGQTLHRGRYGDLGFSFRLWRHRFLVTEVEPNSPAGAVGVHAGWLMQRVEGEPMRSLIDQSLDVHPAAQAPVTAWQWALERLLGAPGSEVRVGFLDGKDQRVNLDLVRRQPPGRPVHLGALPLLFSRFQSEWRKTPAGRPAGVIRFNLFLTPMARKFEAAVDRFRSAAGIVIDLRGNLGGVAAMVMGLAGHFLDQPVSLGELKLRSSSLQFTANPRRSTESGKRVKPYSGPLVILVDGLTASAAEIFAGSLQDIGRATIIGRRTAGEALPALLDRLPDGDVLMHAFADYTTPSGVRLEGRGVHPDVKVAIDRPALLAGRDPALEAALAWVDRRNSRLSVKASE